MVVKHYALNKKLSLSLRYNSSVKILQNSLKSESGDLHLIPNQYVKCKGRSSDSFFLDIFLTMSQCQILYRAVTPPTFYGIHSKVNQVVSNQYNKYQAYTLNSFRDILLTITMYQCKIAKNYKEP